MTEDLDLSVPAGLNAVGETASKSSVLLVSRLMSLTVDSEEFPAKSVAVRTYLYFPSAASFPESSRPFHSTSSGRNEPKSNWLTALPSESMILPVQFSTGEPASLAADWLITMMSEFPSPSGENTEVFALIFASGGVLSRVNSGDFTKSGTYPFEYFALTTA